MLSGRRRRPVHRTSKPAVTASRRPTPFGHRALSGCRGPWGPDVRRNDWRRTAGAGRDHLTATPGVRPDLGSSRAPMRKPWRRGLRVHERAWDSRDGCGVRSGTVAQACRRSGGA
jgi:hypothetical protein